MTSINDNMLRKLPRKTFKDIWLSLKDKYEDKNLQNVIFLRRRFLNSKQEAKESIEDYIDRVELLKEELESISNTIISDEDAIMTILSGISDQYDSFVQCLTVNAKAQIKLVDVIKSLKTEEKRRNEKRQDVKTTENEQAFNTKTKHFKKKKFFKDIKCYNCDKIGHYASDCKSPQKKTRNNKKVNVNISNNKKEDFIFQTSEQDIKSRSLWLLDSGATNHICCSKEMFQSLAEYNSFVQVGDGRNLEVNGKGNIKLQTITTSGMIINLTISEALYVPELTTNLISLGKLSSKRLKIVFENDSCKIFLNEELSIEAKKSNNKNNLYELETISDLDQALLTENVKNWKLWHYRLGHLSTKNMEKLKAEDVDMKQEKLEKEFCEDCALGKSTKLPHKTVLKNEGLEDYVIILSDLAGPMKTTSIGLKKYMLTYLCSKTEYSFVFFLKKKNEQFENIDISRWNAKRFSFNPIANNSLNDCSLTTGANVSVKSIPSSC